MSPRSPRGRSSGRGAGCALAIHGTARRPTNGPHLGCLEESRATGSQLAEAHGSDAHADEPGDRRVDGAEHAAELPLPALGEGGEVPGEPGLELRIKDRGELADLGGRGGSQRPDEPSLPLVQTAPGVERKRLLAGEWRPEPDRVFALDPEPRMEHH